jgi:hypothetical protein
MDAPSASPKRRGFSSPIEEFAMASGYTYRARGGMGELRASLGKPEPRVIGTNTNEKEEEGSQYA